MTFLLVMLHTGTMFAVLVYFWKRWKRIFQGNGRGFVRNIIVASAVTGFVGLALKVLIEKIILEKFLGHTKGEVEELFQHLPLIAANLLVVGALIVYAGKKATGSQRQNLSNAALTDQDSLHIGLFKPFVYRFEASRARGPRFRRRL